MTPSIAPHRFAGVTKIVRFNMPFYAASVLGLFALGALLASSRLPRRFRPIVACGAALATFWTLSSLVVSWYVYDYAGVTRWAWIPERLGIVPSRWANIHAGLDESTLALQHLFPNAEGIVIDIYDPAEMTEPSIARARSMYPAAAPFLVGKSDALPLPGKDRDTVFLLFAAHEVRDPARRTQLLRESARILSDKGHVVLLEHLRDWNNLAAFGPGFLHFHSERKWRINVRDAGLQIEQAVQVTPFVRCFILRKEEA